MSSKKRATDERENGANQGSTHFTRSDYGLICDWLELEKNREALDGVKGKTKVGTKPVVRAKAFEDLAEYVNKNQKKGSKLSQIDGKSMKTRYRYYKKRYLAAKALTGGTGWGLSEEDIAEGFKLVEEKLESECPWYSRMDEMFKLQPNVAKDKDYQSKTPVDALNLVGEESQGNVPNEEPRNELNENTEIRASKSPLPDVQYSPELDELGEEVPLDPFIPDSVPINEHDCVPDSMAPEFKVHNLPASNLPTDVPREGPEVMSGRGGVAPPPRRAATCRDRRSFGEELDSDRPPPNGNTDRGREADHNGSGGGPGVTRARPQSAGQEHPYPSKKQIGDTRHGINSSFAANLQTQNAHKEKTNVLRAEKIEQDRAFEERKFEWQQEMHDAQREDQRELEGRKLDWDREKFREEKAQKIAELQLERQHKLTELELGRQQKMLEIEAARVDRVAQNNLQMKLALISKANSIVEAKELLELLGPG